MIILGICNDETASACLMIDGVICYAASEERFSRKKLDNSFPVKSIEACLNEFCLKLSDVHIIAYSWAKGFDTSILETYVARCSELSLDGSRALEIFRDRIKWEVDISNKKRLEFDAWVNQNIDPTITKVLDFYHHEAHAASAAFLSPLETGLVLTCDGRGDFESTTLWQYNKSSTNPLKKIYSATSSDSFGYFYGRITGLLDFTPMKHEGKITGLAAHGNPDKALPLMEKMISIENGSIKANLGEYYRPFFEPYSKKLITEIKSFSREDVAAAAQKHLEISITKLLDYYLADEHSASTNIMLAGGVFGNVKVTQKIKELKKVSKVFVQPQMGDGGLCLGACALAHAKSNKDKPIAALTSMYLGSAVKFDKSKRLQNSIEYTDFDVVYKTFCNDMAAGKVIGLMQGKMEFGPRALCNRSIIYKSSDSSINDWLNKRMNRTEFMPFAPVIRKEVIPKVIKNFKPDDITLNFMTSTVDCTEEFSKKCPAVVHIDGTARPQVVDIDNNNFIWKVLKHWEEKTGELSLVNTSFNAHEEPIVNTFEDGYHGLKSKMIDVLWVIEEKIAFRVTE